MMFGSKCGDVGRLAGNLSMSPPGKGRLRISTKLDGL